MILSRQALTSLALVAKTAFYRLIWLCEKYLLNEPVVDFLGISADDGKWVQIGGDHCSLGGLIVAELGNG